MKSGQGIASWTWSSIKFGMVETLVDIFFNRMDENSRDLLALDGLKVEGAGCKP